MLFFCFVFYSKSVVTFMSRLVFSPLTFSLQVIFVFDFWTCPVTDWRPVPGVPLLQPHNNSRDRLQQPPPITPKGIRRVKEKEGWMTSGPFFVFCRIHHN